MTEMRRPSDEAADRAIDSAVREIMSAEPAPGFRHRVMNRLSEPEPWHWRWHHGLAAAAVAVLLAFAIWTRPTPKPEPPTIAARAPDVPAAATPASPVAKPAPTPSRPQKRSSAPAAEFPRLANGVIAPLDQIVRAASLPEDVDAPARAGEPESTDRPSAPATPHSASAIPPIAIDAIVIRDIVVAPIPVVRR